MKKLFKQYLLSLLALGVIAGLYSLTLLPEPDKTDRSMFRQEFRFSTSFLEEPKGSSPAGIRAVNPQYEHISAWISSVGAAVTLTDIDGNGLSNDIVHVDPRYDEVRVFPAEHTPASYTSFRLAPRTLRYDDRTIAPMGTLAYDFNGDGRMDILVYYWGRTPIIFYQETNGFREQELVPGGERWYTNAATLADFDGDGKVDILIANYFPDGERVLDTAAKGGAQTMQHSMSRAYNGGRAHFFLSTAGASSGSSFMESKDWDTGIGHPQAWTLAVGAADLTGDLLPEIYFANDFGPDRMLYNLSTPGHLHFKELKGKRGITDIRSGVVGRDSFKGMGVDFGDVNGDGLLDIYVSNISAEFSLEESNFLFVNTGRTEEMKNGVAPFVNESEQLGLSRSYWGWEAKLADLNNDGQPEALQATGFVKGSVNRWAELQELAMANDELLANPGVWPVFDAGADLSGSGRLYLFAKNSTGRYFDISGIIGCDQPQISRGIAVSDIDHDGDLDFVVANQWDRSRLYTNRYSGTNKFLGLRIMHAIDRAVPSALVDPSGFIPARFAIGATVKLLLSGGRTMPLFVDGGNGHSGKNSNEIFAGLGPATADQAVPMEITWRDGKGTVRKASFALKPGWHTIILP